MTYLERQALNGLLANQQYFNARSDNNFALMSASSTVGTPYAIDGQTGRTLAAIADGMARFNSIASSNQLGLTSGAFGSATGVSGFSDGKAV